MAWADDARCLFCDGKLPLFRKLAQGQFCSKQHQDAYWKEQNQLAVEVLHRTHDALQSYKPAGSIEDILGPTAPPPAASVHPLLAPQTELQTPALEALGAYVNEPTVAPAGDDYWSRSWNQPVSGPDPALEPEAVEESLAEPAPSFSWAIHELKPYVVERASPPEPEEERRPSWIREQSADEYSFSYALPVVEELREPEPEVKNVPDLAGLLATAGLTLKPGLTAHMRAVDPLEYETRIAFEWPRLSLAPIAPPEPSLTAPEPASLAERMALAGRIEMTGPALAGCALEFTTRIEAREPHFETIAPPLELAAVLALLEAGQVELDEVLSLAPVVPKAGLKTEGLVGAELEPLGLVAGAAQFASVLDRAMVPQGDVIEQMEQEAFPFHESLLPIGRPVFAAPPVPQPRQNVEARAFAATAAAQPSFTFSLPAATGLREATALHNLSCEVQALDSEGVLYCDLQPVEPRNLTAVKPRGEFGIEQDPAWAPLVELPLAVTPADSPASARRVAYEAVSASPEVERPGAATPVVYHVFAPNLCETQQKLNFQDRVRAREGKLALRGTMVPSFEIADPKLPRPKFTVRPMFEKSSAAAAIAAVSGLFSHVGSGVSHFWNHAPRDLKLMLFAVPVALALAFHPSLPKVSTEAPPTAVNTAVQEVGGFQQAMDSKMSSLRKAIADRAAVGLDENFRHGLDAWQAIDGSTAEWSFDQAGFVVPGRVALYKPSLGLKDYEMQFLGAVDKGALSWVVRASDFQNFYVVKLAILKNGAIPQLGVTRYAVVDGKAVDRVDTPVALDARRDSLYRVAMKMEGDHFALTIQGRVIDSWNEPRLKHGGVGFFTNRGEQSRIGWVQVTHQYDMLGRLFAYLAP